MAFKTIFILIALAVLALAVFFYIIGDSSDELVNNTAEQEMSNSVIDSNSTMQPGMIGEVTEDVDSVTEKEDNIVISPIMPKDIFSTTGIILEIKQDSLIIRGDGNNFVDGVQRELTCLASEQTFVVVLDKTVKQGIDFLTLLKIGDEVLVKSSENIRGKTQFTVKSIKILK